MREFQGRVAVVTGPGIGVSVRCPGVVITPMTETTAGIEPEIVADHVVSGIGEERFGVLTPLEWSDAVRVRCEGDLAGTAPVMPEEAP
jgi:hypothetical protein